MLSYKRYLNKDFLNGKDPNYISKFYQTDDIFWTSSGRGSFEFILQSLDFKEGECVLVPAIIAHGIILPLKRKKIPYILYSCDRDLNPNINDIDKKILHNKVKLIVIVHYFGFPKDNPELFDNLRKRNIIILEDCAQAFLSRYDDGIPLGKKGDIALFSIPKFIPSLDASFIIYNNSKIRPQTINYHKSIFHYFSLGFYHLYLKIKKIQSLLPMGIINSILDLVSKGIYFFYYKLICLQRNPVKVSGYSTRLIKEFDFEKYRQIRIENSRKIFKALQDSGADLISKSLNDYCITGIPVRSKLRSQIINKFRWNNIELLTYIKLWNFIPKKDENLFPSEINFQQSHFLIPISENFSDTQVEFIIKSCKQILNTTF